jgi:glycosyltransferase involved in cell wall biosynthesis
VGVAVGTARVAPGERRQRTRPDRRAVGITSAIGYDETGIILDDLAQTSSYDRSRPYLLFVSTIEPRKNIANLVAAFNRLKEQRRIDHDLLLVGKKGWHYEPIFEAIAQSPWREQIHHLDYLGDRQVQALYAKADVFVYPSYYEGFGLPVLEAMTLGAPVVTSNVSSLPEVAGDAALYADPHDPEELADQIWRLIDSPTLRQDLITRGRAQAAQFSWRRTAEDTLMAYQSLF